MLRHLTISFAAAAALMLAPALAVAGQQDFTLVNATGYVISQVHVSATGVNDWEEDVLGQDTLDDDASVNISFSRAGNTCLWDLQVTYEEDDSTAEWGKINLCKVSKVTIHYNEKTEQTSATYE